MLITLVPTKFLRYEAHLHRQLCRAIDQLERLQRQRQGETVPPPLNINLGEGDTFSAKRSQEVLCFQWQRYGRICRRNCVLTTTVS